MSMLIPLDLFARVRAHSAAARAGFMQFHPYWLPVYGLQLSIGCNCLDVHRMLEGTKMSWAKELLDSGFAAIFVCPRSASPDHRFRYMVQFFWQPVEFFALMQHQKIQPAHGTASVQIVTNEFFLEGEPVELLRMEHE